MPRSQLEIISDLIDASKLGLSSVYVDNYKKNNLIYLYNELVSTFSIGGQVTSVNALIGDVPLIGTSGKITISAANVFNIGADVVTLSDAQVLSNKTGLISQWTNDSGYLTSTGITPSALTKTDDTNVTLSLSGSPTTSLLAATSLTLGWTGTLADARITSAATWNSKQAGHANLTSLSGLVYASSSFVKMTAAGTFALDTNTYLTSNQNIAISGDVSGGGSTAITTTIGALKIATGMIQANAVTLPKLAQGNSGTIIQGVTSSDSIYTSSPTISTSVTTPMIIGGTGTTSNLIIKPTTGVGAAGKAINMNVGNNGSTQAVSVYNNGSVSIGDDLSPYSGIYSLVVYSNTGGLIFRAKGSAQPFIYISNDNAVSGGQLRGLDTGGLILTNPGGTFTYLSITSSEFSVVPTTQALITTPFIYQNYGQNANTEMRIANRTPGTTSQCRLFLFSDTSDILLNTTSGSYTPTSGMITANSAILWSNLGSRMNIGNVHSSPLTFFTNDTERARFNAAGEFIIENSYFFMKNSVSNSNYWKVSMESGVLTRTDTGSTSIP